ncbi:MAG: LysM peptidoglycan-binding domain-containing protein [Bacteroidales bacterium]|nr:LysM peptidoglycan-binding domain-containing protein [Bacteroidales bacterium]
MCCFALLGIAMALAQTTTTHIVDRGETLASIAQKYGTTETRIIELNPDAAQYVYVGMELQIPASTAATPAPATTTVQSSTPRQTYTQPTEVDETTTAQSSTQSYLSSSSASTTEEKSRWLYMFDIGMGWPKGATSFTAAIGGGYKVFQDLYVGARLGYLEAWDTKREGGYNTEWRNGAIVLPIDLGLSYDFNESGTCGIQPYLGFQPGISIVSKYKVKQGSKKISSKNGDTGKFCTDFHLGLRLKIYTFGVWVGYSIPIGDDQKGLMGTDKGVIWAGLCASLNM